ncbi:glycosyltransferase family 4 protein [Haloarcula sp. S1CR25-12]|uniref:Glycosyltransferase family 4 protein n=1 Tax=Haloarcula saliterrae TaxID=2950534 RepID=A0ABU2FBY1_9EURY|nr:glycosyltransferase family 4 protein [Haloarcula sp. S1CR25-12]MDS0259778.1 glycosyltransferase family 4 protein [Haloarcula sp. S1CR25-12]
METIALSYQKRRHAESLSAVVESLPVPYTVEIIEADGLELFLKLTSGNYSAIQTDEALRRGGVAALASSYLDVPLIVDIQGWADYLNTHNQFGRVIEEGIKRTTQFVLSRADGCIFVTREARRRMSARYDFEGWRYAKPVFDVEGYATATPDEYPEETSLLTVTNLRYKEKLDGVKTVLKGIKPLLSEFNVKFRIAGGGRYLSNLKHFVSGYPYADSVEVLGHRDDIPQILASGDVFIYVSYLDSLGMVILEAQASGLPVVASDTGGIPEAVGEAGIVVPPEPTEITESVRTLLRTPELRKELSNQAIERTTNYRRRQAIHHVELWETLLSDS